MDGLSAIGHGWDFVLGRRSTRLELSDPRYPCWCFIRFVGGSLRGVLHCCLPVPGTCPWILVGHNMGICDRRHSDLTVWSSAPPRVPNAVDFIRAGGIARACCV